MIAYLIVGLSLEPPVPIAARRLAGNRGETMTALEYQRRRLLRGDELPAEFFNRPCDRLAGLGLPGRLETS